MKKLLLSGAMLLALSYAANAQTTVWSDNFDDQDISDWTLTDSDGDEKNWGDLFQISDNEGGFITPVSLISRSWEGGEVLTPDNWAVSPVINLAAFSGQTVTLSWLRQSNENFPEDKYSVYVGTSNDISTLEGSSVSFTETVEDGTPTTRTLDLSSFAGNATVYVAFRHYDSSDWDFISVDDVAVVASGTANINDYLTSRFTVSPVPANSVLTISNADNMLVNSVSLTDINGRIVKTSSFEGVATAQLNVADLTNGVYMLNVATDNGTFTKKVVKN